MRTLVWVALQVRTTENRIEKLLYFHYPIYNGLGSFEMQMKTKMYKLSLGFGSVAYWSWGFRVSIFPFNLLKFSYSWIWMEKIPNHQMTPNNLFSLNETQITIKETVFFSIVICVLFGARSQFAINPNPPWGVYAFWP